MADQTETLQKMVANRGRPTRVVAVSSGKGGVGKSNFALNVAVALSRSKRRVLLMDADMGLANIDILIGAPVSWNISHVLTNDKTLEEVLVEGPGGIHVLPSASGVEWMTELTTAQKLDFLQKMDALEGRYDILLIDTGAGISSNVIYFNLGAQTRIVMVTPEPTSLTDAYALIKVLSRTHRQRDFEVVVNATPSEKEALEVYRNLTAVTDRFLDVRVGYLGHVVQDPRLGKAVLRQQPVVEFDPEAPSSQCYRAVARRLDRMPPPQSGAEMGLFWRKVFEASLA